MTDGDGESLSELYLAYEAGYFFACLADTPVHSYPIAAPLVGVWIWSESPEDAGMLAGVRAGIGRGLGDNVGSARFRLEVDYRWTWLFDTHGDANTRLETIALLWSVEF
jgi:hypothetical protein